MFKKIKPNYHMSGASSGLFVSHKKEVDVDGVKCIEFANLAPQVVYPDLPDPENFSLDAQIASGVPLQPVDTTLLSPSRDSVIRAESAIQNAIDSAQKSGDGSAE